MPKLNNAQKRNLDLKKRYNVYRSLGYSPVESRKMSQKKSIKVDDIKLRTNKAGLTTVVRNKAFLSFELDQYVYEKSQVKNRSVYTNWGNLTQRQPHASDTMKMARKVAKRDKQTLDYGYYYLYLMTENGYTDREMKEIVKTDKSFEMYMNRYTGSGHKTRKEMKPKPIQESRDIDFKTLETMERDFDKKGKKKGMKK